MSGGNTKYTKSYFLLSHAHVFFVIATEKNNASTKIVKINGDKALIMNPISSGMTKVCNVQVVVE